MKGGEAREGGRVGTLRFPYRRARPPWPLSFLTYVPRPRRPRATPMCRLGDSPAQRGPFWPHRLVRRLTGRRGHGAYAGCPPRVARRAPNVISRAAAFSSWAGPALTVPPEPCARSLVSATLSLDTGDGPEGPAPKRGAFFLPVWRDCAETRMHASASCMRSSVHMSRCAGCTCVFAIAARAAALPGPMVCKNLAALSC